MTEQSAFEDQIGVAATAVRQQVEGEAATAIAVLERRASLENPSVSLSDAAAWRAKHVNTEIIGVVRELKEAVAELRSGAPGRSARADLGAGAAKASRA